MIISLVVNFKLHRCISSYIDMHCISSYIDLFLCGSTTKEQRMDGNVNESLCGMALWGPNEEPSIGTGQAAANRPSNCSQKKKWQRSVHRGKSEQWRRFGRIGRRRIDAAPQTCGTDTRLQKPLNWNLDLSRKLRTETPSLLISS